MEDELTVEKVNNTVRPLFEINVGYVQQYLNGVGADFGCGSCPLLIPPCKYYVDMSPQPLAVEQVIPIGGLFFHQKFEDFVADWVYLDFIFSSHALEDLENEIEITSCLDHWSTLLKVGGYVVILIPDIEGGRYPTVEEGGNCSHKVIAGRTLFEKILKYLPQFEIVQIDTIPHTSETMDMVLKKVIP